MDHIPYHPCIEVTDEDVKKVRMTYGLEDTDRIKESLDAIQEWCKKQEHIVEGSKYLDRNILERIFILAKGSVEGMKERIDKMFTYRGMIPELCMNWSVEEFHDCWDCVNYVPLPKLCRSDQSRVMVTQFLTDKLESFSLLTYFRFGFMIGHYRLHYDYSISERFILDLNNFNLGVLTKINPTAVKKAEIMCTQGFGTKIKGIHIVNAPPFVDKIIFLLKQAVRDKVARRIHVHNSFEDLHKHIPKEILPVDYDGEEPSCSKLFAKWKEILRTEQAKEIIENCNKLITDETKRHTKEFNEEYLGMPGSFRKLRVD